MTQTTLRLSLRSSATNPPLSRGRFAAFPSSCTLVALFALGLLGSAGACKTKKETCVLPGDDTATPPGAACTLDDQCAAVKGQTGVCVAGICGLTPTSGTCSEDGGSAGCPAGYHCRVLTLETGSHGACLPKCGCGPCDGGCDAQGTCMPTQHQSCDPRGCSIFRGPPLVCKTPPALGEGPYFTNITAEVGLDASDLNVVGNRLAWMDIDGDGFPELFVHSVASLRDELEADPPVRRKRVLKNVADPQGGRRFADHTDASGYTTTRDASELGRAAGFAIFADVNNDGHLDVFSGTPVHNNDPDLGDRSEILLGNGDGTFTLAPRSDTSPEGRMATHAAAFLDYDLDGNVDLFVGNQYGEYGYLGTMQQDRLYRGDGSGAFGDVTDSMGLTTVRGVYYHQSSHRATDGVTVCDVNGDGYPDIITSSYGRAFNALWENLGGAEFRNIAEEKGADADGNLDYSDNELFRCHCQLAPGPECEPNPGAPRIACGSQSLWTVGVDDQPWRLAGTTFSTVCGDIDNDGDMDLFEAQIRHWYHGGSSDPSQFLLNTGGPDWTFERPGLDAMGIHRRWSAVDWNEGDITAGFLDFDNDGFQDLYVGSSDYPATHAFLFRQLNNGIFSDRTEESGAGHYYGNGIAFADFDRDGDLDIAVGSSTMRCSQDPNCTWTQAEVHLYRNEVGQDSNWLAIRVVGAGPPGANVAGIGARVVVVTGETSQLREVQGGYGHFGIQHTLVQHFGLGAHCVADEVVVFWPNRSFTHTRIPFVPANYFVTINEATGEVTYEPPAQ